jgi:3',5'-cyclic AMP phosphodiesterase CpdA
MRTRILAHLSDLHIGLPARDRAAADLCRALRERDVDHVVVTGDITHRGRRAELERFRALFAPLAEAGRLTVVPGNHDRWNDDVAGELLGERVAVRNAEELHLVQVDSSGPHNRTFFISHGSLGPDDLDTIVAAFAGAPAGTLRVLLLHHHLLPLPEEGLGERLAALIGWPHVGELDVGARLLSRLRGVCDVVLHGHRHRPSAYEPLPGDPEPLAMYNAGSSTELGRARLLEHAAGRLLRASEWLRSRPAAAAAAA